MFLRQNHSFIDYRSLIPRFSGPGLIRNVSNLSSEHNVTEALSEESIDQLIELENELEAPPSVKDSEESSFVDENIPKPEENQKNISSP